ncbi:hypothetical protein SAMN06265360_107109 [Haloechinothrix alba]|uniref:MmpS family membrane protein n=1 Tax=Haloechinothrix alba TaxID=664784 RepID=A0A238WRS6_9PSEU|nr:hypothetical protein [Haloechinothrix alba]SNR48954.1 hypothetical protein SAMN06265360_107109 [Haloechinothrix alba]
MKRPAVVVLAATFLTACTSGADDPAEPADPPSAPPSAPQSPSEQQEPDSTVVHVRVTGPQDTVMLVARDGQQSQVELEGEPFDFEFTETGTASGHLDIRVFAKSEHPEEEPVRCSISLDGEVAIEDSASTVDENGIAEVSCTLARST